ncbi:MAG: hypothetical protein ACJ8F7_12625 [Gemmataceae bacterium]
MNANSGDGKAAVHRWFEAGESWAAHPWFDDREPLYDALRAQLQGADGPFVVPALGGVLVGEKVPDIDCPDPKARDRHPTILRVVFASEEPTARQRDDLLRKLRKLPLPTSPGANAGLELPPPARRSPRRAAKSKPADEPAAEAGPPFSPKALVVGALFAGAVLLIVAGGIYLVGPMFFGPANGHTQLPTSPQTSSQATTNITAPSENDLTPLHGEVPYLNERTRGRFLQPLGSAAVYDHPYCAYLKETAARLPESAPRCQGPEDVRQGLRQLLAGLQPDLDTADWSNEHLKDAIDVALTYENWRRGPGARNFRDRGKLLPEPQRRFVERFRRPEPPLRDALTAMSDLLRTWGDPADAGRPPFVTAERFFALLVRPANLPSPLALDHPKVAFLARLPAEPVAAGQAFDADADLAAALRRLLLELDGDATPGPAVALVARVGRQMRYADWLADRPETFRDKDAELPPDVARVVRRFER